MSRVDSQRHNSQGHREGPGRCGHITADLRVAIYPAGNVGGLEARAMTPARPSGPIAIRGQQQRGASPLSLDNRGPTQVQKARPRAKPPGLVLHSSEGQAMYAHNTSNAYVDYLLAEHQRLHTLLRHAGA